MKKLFSVPFLMISVLSIAQPGIIRGQDFFRDFGTSRSSGGFGPVYPSEYGYQATEEMGVADVVPGQDPSIPQITEDLDSYNFAIGNFRFGIAAGIGFEWNDNITLSENDRKSDVIFRPIVNLEAIWQMSELNTLRFNVGISYAKYFDHPEYDTDGVLFSPDSELALTFFVGSVKFTLSDRFGYQEDAYDVPQLSNVADYGRWENQASLDIDWAINQNINLELGYSNFNLWPTDDVFYLEERSINTVYLKPGFQVAPGIKIGLNGTYSWINFASDQRSDGYNILAGAYIEWQITEFTKLYLEGGYQALNYDGSSNYFDVQIDELGLSDDDAAAVQSILADNSDSDSYYIKFEINNQLTESYRQRLLFTKTAEIGFYTNYYDLYHVEYNAEWKIFEHCEIGPSVFYEYYTSSGQDGEDADRIGVALGIRYHLTNSLTLGLDYRYIWKDSNLEGQDYYQNVAFLSLYYKF